MNEQKFPWAMDIPLDSLVGSEFTEDELLVYCKYLFQRVKKSESERDERYTRSATSVIREEQERHADELAKVNDRLEVAVEALEHIMDRDYQLVNLGWKGKELQRFAREALAKLRSM